MTEQQIYAALCELDPALEPWQKCEHEWHLVRCFEEAYNWTANRLDCDYRTKTELECVKCTQRATVLVDAPLPTFGDGKPRYRTVDELLALCERLGLWFLIGNSFQYDGEFKVEAWPAHQHVSAKAAHTHSHSLVAALREAILRACGKWEVEA